MKQCILIIKILW